MSQQTAPRTPCLPADAQNELEELRAALQIATDQWGAYYVYLWGHYLWDSTHGKPWLLDELSCKEREEYRRCLALLDPREAG